MKLRPVLAPFLLVFLVASLFFLYKQAPASPDVNGILTIQQGMLSKAVEKDDPKEEARERAEYTRERAQHEFEMLRNPVTGRIPADIRNTELMVASRIPDKQTYSDAPVFGITRVFGVTGPTVQNAYQNIGPTNVAGRSRTLAFDKRNPNIMLTGGTTGGIFRSTDGGTTWTFVTPENEIRSATAIVQDPLHSDTWYCGTGEAWYTAPQNIFANTLGDGIFKSTDNGVTWSKLASTASNPSLFDSPFDLVHRLAVQPTTGYVYAAVHRRIMRSKDGGQTWEQVMGGTIVGDALQGVTEVVITSDGSKIFAAFSGGNPDRSLAGVWVSSTGNLGDWKRIAGGVKGATDSVAGWRAYGWDSTQQQGIWDRVVLSLNSTNTKLFVLYKNNESSGGATPKPEADLFRCDISSGNPSTYTWTNLNAYVPDEPGFQEENLDPYSTYFNGYAMSLSVKPDNDNIFFIGGTMLHRVDLTQTDPAKKFRRIGGYGRGFLPGVINEYTNHHPDVHGIYFLPGTSTTLFTADDGGVHKTTNNMADTVRWQILDNGLQTVQYQTISISPDVQDFTVIGGAQDNGTLVTFNATGSNPGTAELFSGDGASSAVSTFTKNGNTWNRNYFMSVVNGAVYRQSETYNFNSSTNTLTLTASDLQEITPSGLKNQGQWITLLVNDPDSSEQLYYNNKNKLFRTSNASAVTASNWTEITAVGTTVPSNEYFTYMALSKKINGNKYLYVGTNNGHVYRLKNPNTALTNVPPVDVTPTGMAAGSYVAGIAVNPRSPDTVLAVVSNYDESGATVQNIFWTGNATSTTPTWQVLDGALEAVSSQSCEIVVKTTGVEYYVGTSVGLYSTTAVNGNSTQWLHEGSGIMKTAIIRSLKNRQPDNVMVVGTHGNGAFLTVIGSPVAIGDSTTGPGNPGTNDQTFITSVYPTLTTGTVQYQIGNLFTVKNITVRLYNMLGQLVYEEQRGYQNGLVNLSYLARGQYILTIYSDDNKYRYVQKIIRQ